jgi:hypothetical protein
MLASRCQANAGAIAVAVGIAIAGDAVGGSDVEVAVGPGAGSVDDALGATVVQPASSRTNRAAAFRAPMNAVVAFCTRPRFHHFHAVWSIDRIQTTPLRGPCYPGACAEHDTVAEFAEPLTPVARMATSAALGSALRRG